MSEYADLEIGLHRRSGNEYTVEFRYLPANSLAENRLGPQQKPMSASFDLEKLSALQDDPIAYGQALTNILFSDAEIGKAFAVARANALSQGAKLRLRLFLGPTAGDLQNLFWETLHDPDNDAWLAMDEKIYFSRYLSSPDMTPVHRRTKGKQRALVVVASPNDLIGINAPADAVGWRLDPVDVTVELDRVQKALAGVDLTILPNGSQHATLANIKTYLRQDNYDLLYLVCHGALDDEGPWLYLEDEQGKVALTPGQYLVDHLRELPMRPLLVVLASCESASDHRQANSHAALGPSLAVAGIPAVIAMQGQIGIDTAANFIQSFFRELSNDGQIDRAVAIARGEIREYSDCWMPALYMRLREGCLWYEAGFRDMQGERLEFDAWPGLIRSIQKGRCTPILGPGLYEWLLGPLREVAKRWADKYNYPMARQDRESMPQIAQYLSVNYGSQFLASELESYIAAEIRAYFGYNSPIDLKKSNLDQLLSAVGDRHRQQSPHDPYQILAGLPFPIYLSANPGGLMDAALRRVPASSGNGFKDPQVVVCPWNEELRQQRTIFEREPTYSPTPDRPLAYHFFGRLDVEDSLILAEDDYFDFLMGLEENTVNSFVTGALTNSSLLFMGFQMEDWNFRVLLRYILSLQGGDLRKKHVHIAVQVNPEEGRILDPGGAYRYLSKYFTQGANISVYWGSTEDFIAELQRQWATAAE